MSWPLAQMAKAERWIAVLRLGAVAFVVVQLGLIRGGHPPGYGVVAWTTTALFAAGAVGLWLLARRDWDRRALGRLGLAALALDTAAVSVYVVLYAYEPGTPVRLALFIPVIEGAFRYGLVGGVALPFVLAPAAIGFEWVRAGRDGDIFQANFVTFPVGIQLVAGLFVGWLVRELRRTTATAEHRAEEAERLRDELGRRVDVLEAANRCARALASSLELDQAFGAFIRELRGLVPFDRVAIVLAEGGEGEVIAAAGAGADDVFAPGTRRPVAGSVLAEVLEGRLVYRPDMLEVQHSEERELLALGLRCRLVVPLVSGPRTVGMLSLVRSEPDSFGEEEVELVSLLGRLVATGVQNIRAYEAERSTVDELRRLSALRADFVSLVSHELRSPMAAVIGAARTLQQRWRELAPEQRESFLALIADETTRLAALIGDVLDTSRIEAGTFTFSFGPGAVDVLVREAAAAAELGQDEVRVTASVREPLARVRGDRERLRQVLTNLIDNAVKYSPAGGEVRVAAFGHDGRVLVDVSDDGPGIPREHHGLIFEKFGRAKTDGGQPGTGLGLFIARSIVEAHGGTLDVRSTLGGGATFRVALPGDA
jgi:signal transduction histidine kinase